MILKLEGEHEEMDADKSASETATDGEKVGDTDEKKEVEEEPSNLQLAWEMLELTKVVYTKQIETGADNKSEMVFAPLCVIHPMNLAPNPILANTFTKKFTRLYALNKS